MRYLVDRGTGTILGVNDDLVIVDINDNDDIDETGILELADKVKWFNKAIIGTFYETPIFISDMAIATELNDYVYNNEISADNDDNYFYCLSNPDTWPLIRDAVIEDHALWNEYSDTWTNAISAVAERHRYRNEVAE
jgi:hypothetical protein